MLEGAWLRLGFGRCAGLEFGRSAGLGFGPSAGLRVAWKTNPSISTLPSFFPSSTFFVSNRTGFLLSFSHLFLFLLLSADFFFYKSYTSIKWFFETDFFVSDVPQAKIFGGKISTKKAVTLKDISSSIILALFSTIYT